MKNFLIITIFCLNIINISCQKDGKNTARVGRASNKIPTVKVEAVASKHIARQLTVIAPLRGRLQADVFSRVSGKISYIGPKEGEKIKSGALLFRVDRNDPGGSFLNVPIVSPISGWVGRWGVTNIGEQISPDDPIVTVVDDSALRATTMLSLQDWIRVSAQTKVLVKALEETREAKVVAVSRSAELGSGRASVTIEVQNSLRVWRSGMIASVTFFIEPKDRIIIDSSALAITSEGSFVYTVENNIAHRKPVKFEIIDNDSVEITQGLAEKDQIIVLGANLVSENEKVDIASSSSQEK